MEIDISLLEAVDVLSQKEDPEEEPFRSKYQARRRLEECREKIKGIREKTAFAGPEDLARLDDILAFLEYRLGLNRAATEETAEGERQLEAAVAHFEHRGDVFAYILVNALNQLGILWAGRGEPVRALELLKRAETAYSRVAGDDGTGNTNLKEFPLLPEYVGLGEDFEGLHTMTLFFVAQVCAALGQQRESAQYCQATLQRQLSTGKFDALEWVANTIGLAEYYATTLQPNIAQYVLCAATAVLDDASKRGALPPPTEDDSGVIDGEKKVRADLDVAWCKVYGGVLEMWARIAKGRLTPPEPAPPLVFAGLEVPPQKEFSTQPRPLAEAKVIFNRGQEAAQAAKTAYALDGHVTKHVDIVQLHSRMYRFLAELDPNQDNKCKMHKRRLDMLIPLATELSPVHFKPVVESLFFEIAETYADMFFVKLHQNEEAPDRHAPQRVNELGINAIKFFTMFTESVHPKGALRKVDEEIVSSYMAARHARARIYSRLYTSGPADDAENSTRALAEYRWVLDYAEATGDTEVAAEVVDMSRQMVELLPQKIAVMRAKVSQAKAAT